MREREREREGVAVEEGGGGWGRAGRWEGREVCVWGGGGGEIQIVDSNWILTSYEPHRVTARRRKRQTKGERDRYSQIIQTERDRFS